MGSQDKRKDQTMESRKRKRSSELITSQDVIFEILLRVPAKSLMRFKTTCKQWNSIISEGPKFAELHSRTHIQKLRLLFTTRSGKGTETRNHFWIYKFQENEREMKNLGPLQIRGVDRFMIPMDSSGSLVLFYVEVDYLSTPMYLLYDCNNDNQMILPQLPSDAWFIREQYLLYDPSTNMHKVLVYAADPKDFVTPDFCYITSFRNTKNLVMENGWRKQSSPFKTRPYAMKHIAIKGILYWLFCAITEDRENCIQLFDIGKEKFLNMVACPKLTRVAEYPSLKFKLLEFRGSLGLVFITGIEFKIWVLKDSGSTPWVLLHKIRMHSSYDDPVRSQFGLRPIFVLQNLKNLPSILFEGHDKTYLFDMNDEKVREMNDLPLQVFGSCFAAWFS